MMGLSNSFGETAPPPLDLNEFPSLTSRNSENSQSNPNPLVGRQPYGNCLFGQGKMLKQSHPGHIQLKIKHSCRLTIQ